MKGLLIRRFALLAAVTLSVIGCKRDVQNPEDNSGDELTLTARRPSAIEVSSAPSKAESTLEEFVVGSAIGLYTQLKSESDLHSTVVMKSNSMYTYSIPVWSPASKEEKLTYDKVNNAPIYIFGYYPHSSMPATTTKVDPGSSIAEYRIHKDQSAPLSVSMSDLLWVGATNSGTGYVRQRTPLSLKFQHSLCKVSFYVKLIDSNPGINNPQKAYLRNLATIGEQIASQASLDILTGVVTAKYSTTPMDSIFWNSTSDRGVELTVGEPAIHITDMLLIPFKAVKRKNYFRSMLYYDAEDRAQNFNAYIPEFDPAATGDSAGKLCFESNKHNKVTITIDISDIYMNITAEIEPWGTGPEVDLPAERD